MKVLVTPRSFGRNNPRLFTRLEKAGLEIIRNDSGAVLDELQMATLLASCTGLIVGIDPVTAKVLKASPGLRAIAKYGVGLDNIDLEDCARRNIKVSRTVGANSNAVADYTFALMLGVARRIAQMDRECRNGIWPKISGMDIYGKTLGIIGLGAIGKGVARRAAGFGMKILAHDIAWDEDFARQYHVKKSDVDEICRKADFISLHAALTDATRNILDARRFGLLKKTAVIVNTARGELIDETALLDCLEARRIFGAGIDAFAVEPPADPRWYALDNVILSSHCASSTPGATEAMGEMAVSNLLESLGLED